MRRILGIGIAVCCASLSRAQQAQTGSQMLDQVIRTLDAKRDTYAGIAQQIWSFAEVGYQDEKSSALLQTQLRSAGFNVRAGVADIPTAFVASYGSGKPVIGFVGEFDALPALDYRKGTQN